MKTPNKGKVLIAENATIGSHCQIGEDGFHFVKNIQGKFVFTPHEYGVQIEDHVWIGSHCSIDRGRVRDTAVGGGSIIDNHVHISHNVIIGNNCVIGAHVTLLGSVEVGDDAEIWSNAVIHQGVKIGKGAVVGANTYLRHDLADNMCAYISDKTGQLVVKPKLETKKYGNKKVEKKGGGGSKKPVPKKNAD